MKRWMWIAGGVVAVLVLASAAFVSARLLNTSDPKAGPAGEAGVQNVQVVTGGGGGPIVSGLRFEEAPELPDTPPAVAGLFVRRQDNSIFVGTGEIEVAVDIVEGGKPNVSASFNGPVVEVVVTGDTSIYRDVTDMGRALPASSGEKTVQRVVKPVDSLEELGESGQDTEIRVWGRQRGDRVVAEVFVFQPLGALP